MEERKKKLHYGWIIFGCSFVMVMIALGFCSSVKSLYLPVITENLSIPRSLYSITDSCRYIVTAVMNLLFGFFVQKHSPRKLVAYGFLALIASCLLFSFATHVVVFYIGGCFLGVGLAWTTTTMVGYFVEKWFTKSKGTIMGIILAANGVGASIAAQVLTPMIYSETNDNGWRVSYRFTAALLAVVGLFVVFLLRNKPEDKGLEPLGANAVAKAKRGSKWDGISSKDAFRKPYTYISLICVFLVGACLQACSGCSTAHMRDIGYDPALLANVVSIQMLILAGAKMLTGVSFDRLGLRLTMLICSACSVLAFLILALMTTQNSALPYFYSFVVAFGLPLETVMLPLIASDLYGQKDYSKMMGIIVAINTMGYFVGAPAINLVYDKLGTYVPAFYIGIAILVVSAIGMQFVISAAHRQRAAIEAACAENKDQ